MRRQALVVSHALTCTYTLRASSGRPSRHYSKLSAVTCVWCAYVWFLHIQ